MGRTIAPVLDSTGKAISLHDMLLNEETGETAVAIYATNLSGVQGLAVENEEIGIGDWLDVYPDGIWTIVGNADNEEN